MNAIEVRGLTRRFGAFAAVSDVTFDVRQGEIFGFLGSNGAGKSTTIRMLCGLLRPTAGIARVGGIDVGRDPEAVKQRIGYMSQRFSLYEDQGRDYGYERGEFSRIPLAWNDKTGELTIGARQGRYPGMQAQREIRVRWIDGPRADAGAVEPEADRTVRYTGQAVTVRRPRG